MPVSYRKSTTPANPPGLGTLAIARASGAHAARRHDADGHVARGDAAMPSRLTAAVRGPRSIVVLLAAITLVASGCAAASAAPSSFASTPGGTSVPAIGAPAVAPGVPAVGGAGTTTTGAVGASGAGTANAAAIYPYPGYGGTPGVAPDHTIVVTGSGQATVKADLSNRAAAQRAAITAALADAKAQAGAVAGETSVTLGGVLSVSVSTSASYAIPMLGSGTVPPMTPQAGSGTTGPTVVPVEPTSTELVVSVTVEYRIS
jgi:hypothetical protein